MSQIYPQKKKIYHSCRWDVDASVLLRSVFVSLSCFARAAVSQGFCLAGRYVLIFLLQLLLVLPSNGLLSCPLCLSQVLGSGLPVIARFTKWPSLACCSCVPVTSGSHLSSSLSDLRMLLPFPVPPAFWSFLLAGILFLHLSQGGEKEQLVTIQYICYNNFTCSLGGV